MLEIIFLLLILYYIQVWLTPVLLNLNNINYFLSNRDIEYEFSDTTKRVYRAADNLKESLPAFLTLSVLSIFMDKDNTLIASYWLILRVAFFVTYSFGITILYVRSIIWGGSLLCLFFMALSLLN